MLRGKLGKLFLIYNKARYSLANFTPKPYRLQIERQCPFDREKNLRMNPR